MEPDYSKYDDMGSDKLRELIREDMKRPPEESDTEAMLYISRVLATRSAAFHLGPDVDKAWESFQRDYLPYIDGDDAPKAHKKRGWRVALAVAALAAVLVVGAYGVGTRGWFARWTGDEFHYTEVQAEKISITEPEEPFETLEEALAYYGAPEDMVPAVLPDGYEYAKFEYSIVPEEYATFTVGYENGDNIISLSYMLYADEGSARDTYKNEAAPEIYITNNKEHYIMTNTETYTAIWHNGNFECSMYGFENKTDIIVAIDSMYDGE